MTSATMFYYTKVMINLFEGSQSVNKVEDFWGVRGFLSNFGITTALI